jgi:putative two-component system response regulator
MISTESRRATSQLAAEWPAEVLVADDDTSARRLLRRVLESAGYQVVEALDGTTARLAVERSVPDLMILDIHMPGTDGIALCRDLKHTSATSLMPIIHITGSTSRTERLEALAAGSDDFVGKPFDIEELLTRVRSLLRTRRLTNQLVSAEAVMIALARTVEARDLYTERHLHRVANRAVSVAERLGVIGSTIESVRLGGLLHDLGKIGVPDSVLLKPAPLNREEFEYVRAHPAIGAEIVRPLGPYSAPETVVLHHHERLDGRGYPAGLRGTGIPLAARIVAVSDAFDAITSDRPYRRGQSPDVALQVLRDGRGTQWDPDVVDAFTEVYAGDLAGSAGSAAEGGLGDPGSGTGRRNSAPSA